MVFACEAGGTTFRRARSEEQREIRRRAILDTAAAMLAEMPVAEVSLNELSRRVGLAKSNVLRYFESREAVLLELLDDFLGTWLDQLGTELAAEVRPTRRPRSGPPTSPRASAGRWPAVRCCATSSEPRVASWSTTSRSRSSPVRSAPRWPGS